MYQIGAFSKICQVSVKTLRYYDKIGLLAPSEVDRFTGYRYYDRGQLGKMVLIQKLKRYGFSLEEIQPLLSCDGEAFYRKLRQQRERLQCRLMELGTVCQELDLHLRSLERTEDTMEHPGRYDIALAKSAPLPVLSCRQMMSVDEFGRYYGTLFERVSREGLTPGGDIGAMYHDEEFNRDASDIELFTSVKEEERADKVIEARLCAVTKHRGAYSTLNEAYAALAAWIEENGYAWDGAPWEIYRKSSWNGIRVDDWETEIFFPVRKRDSAAA